MFQENKAFSSFSVHDLKKAKEFYGKTLGLNISEEPGMDGLLNLNLQGGQKIMIYHKPNHSAASFTILNFIVNNVEETVSKLNKLGVRFEIYNEENLKTDNRGILSGDGVKIAWFKDPSGNILSVLEEGV